MHFLRLLPILFLTLACGGGEGKDPISGDETVSVAPQMLACDEQEQTLTLSVIASGPFQAFAGDDVTWAKAEPAYSAEPKAQVSVKVSKNDTFRDRSTEITIKCGTTRVKVPLTQSGGDNVTGLLTWFHFCCIFACKIIKRCPKNKTINVNPRLR